MGSFGPNYQALFWKVKPLSMIYIIQFYFFCFSHLIQIYSKYHIGRKEFWDIRSWSRRGSRTHLELVYLPKLVTRNMKSTSSKVESLEVKCLVPWRYLFNLRETIWESRRQFLTKIIGPNTCISFRSSNTQSYKSWIFCLFTFWVFFQIKVLNWYQNTPKNANITRYIKKKKHFATP